MAPRADASRNRKRILDSAMDVLGRDPHASMETVADAASVTRMTVYRHFPTRGSLIAAMTGRVGHAAAAHFERIADEAVPIDEAIAGLADYAIDVARRYRRLIDPATVDAAARAGVIGEPVLPALEHRQATGDIRTDLPAAWLASLVRAILITGVKALGDPKADVEEVRSWVRRSLVDILVVAPVR